MPAPNNVLGHSRIRAPDWNFVPLTVVNLASVGVTKYVVGFLQFEELLAAEARKIGMKFKCAPAIGRSNLVKGRLRRYVKNEIVVLSHSEPPISVLRTTRVTTTPWRYSYT